MITETERTFVSELVGAFEADFQAHAVIQAVSGDDLLVALARARAQVTRVEVQISKRNLCQVIADSRRRGELIARASFMADTGAGFASWTGEDGGGTV